jgi:glycosyltransferase involved in cell wall biosynthesis
MPKVSIIIPTYNRFDLLCQTIRSVLNQTYDNYEIIVVDDGSMDQTLTIPHIFSRVRLIPINHSGLPAVARNVGIKESDSEFIAFLDSDDLWFPGKLTAQLQCFHENPDAVLICTNATLVNEEATNHTSVPENIFQNTYFPHKLSQKGNLLGELIKDNFIISSTTILKRNIIQKTGLFDENPLKRAVEDYDLWLKVAALGEMIYLDTPSIHYKVTSNSSIRKGQSISHHYKALLLTFNDFEVFLTGKNLHEKWSKNIKNAKVNLQHLMGVSLWQENKKREALRSIANLIAANPAFYINKAKHKIFGNPISKSSTSTL